MEQIKRQLRLIAFLVKTRSPKWFINSENKKLERLILNVIDREVENETIKKA